MKGYVGSTSRDSRAAAVREEPQSRGRSIEGGGALKKPLKANRRCTRETSYATHTHTHHTESFHLGSNERLDFSAVGRAKKDGEGGGSRDG